MVQATEPLMVWLALSARVTVVPVMSMMGSPRRVAPTPRPAVTLATVTVRLVVELEMTLTLLLAMGTTVPADVTKLSPGCTGFCLQKLTATLVTKSWRVVGGRISSPNK